MAGAVANDGITRNKGENITDKRNSRPAVAEVRPVLPPSITPDALSIRVVMVEVPSTAPAPAAVVSAIRTLLIRGSLPDSSSIPALADTPIRLPSVLNTSTNIQAKISITNSAG